MRYKHLSSLRFSPFLPEAMNCDKVGRKGILFFVFFSNVADWHEQHVHPSPHGWIHVNLHTLISLVTNSIIKVIRIFSSAKCLQKLKVEQKQTKQKTTSYVSQVNKNMVFVLVPTESCSWSSAKVNTVTIFLEADIALLSNPYFAISIPFHSWGVTLELSLPKSFVKYCSAIYWVIVCHYCEIVNCDCLEVNNHFFTCSVFHSSDTCLSIYLGNSCLGNLSIISISFQNREVVVILTICPRDSNKTFDCTVKTSQRALWACLLLSKCHSTPGWARF